MKVERARQEIAAVTELLTTVQTAEESRILELRLRNLNGIAWWGVLWDLVNAPPKYRNYVPVPETKSRSRWGMR